MRKSKRRKLNPRALKRLREDAKLTATQLAAAVGMSAGYLDKIEAGRQKGSIGSDIILGLMDVLDCDFDTLFPKG